MCSLCMPLSDVCECVHVLYQQREKGLCFLWCCSWFSRYICRMTFCFANLNTGLSCTYMYMYMYTYMYAFTCTCTCTCALYSVYMYVLLDWYDEMCLDDQPVYNEECHVFHELTICVCVCRGDVQLNSCCVCVCV